MPKHSGASELRNALIGVAVLALGVIIAWSIGTAEGRVETSQLSAEQQAAEMNP